MADPVPSYLQMASTVRVLVFGPVRAQLGVESFEVRWEDRIRADQLAPRILKDHPQLEPSMGHVRFARAGEFLDAGAWLRPGDEIAMISPVSGG